MTPDKVIAIASQEIGYVEKNDNSNKYGKWYGMDRQPWCFGGEVEILTENGFIPFQELPRGLKVAQVDPDNLTLSLIEPTNYVEKDYTGRLLEATRRGLKGFIVDPNHRFFGAWKRRDRMGAKGNWGNELFPIDDLFNGNGSVVSIPAIKGTNNQDRKDISDKDLQLIAIFLADGFFHKGELEVSCSRPIKKTFFDSLNPSKVYQSKKVYGQRTKTPLTSYIWKVPGCFEEAFESYKCLSSLFCWSLSPKQAGLILDTVTFLDGSLGGKVCNRGTIHQSRKEIIDSLHLLAVIAGRTAQTLKPTITGEFNAQMYGMTFSDIDKPTRLLKKHFQEKFESTKLYCVSVPTELIIVRPKYGKAIIAGNCAIFISYCFYMAGLPLRITTEKGFAYCPFAVHYFQKKNRLFHTTPKRGDIVFFDWNKDKIADHVGIVEQVTPDFIRTIEGNTSFSNQSNGGQVQRRVRGFNTVLGYGRPDYDRVVNSKDFIRQLYYRMDMMRGDDVKSLQQALKDKGYHVEVDGVFGVQTERVTKQFQRDKRLSVDGIVGEQTWKKMFS